MRTAPGPPGPVRSMSHRFIVAAYLVALVVLSPAADDLGVLRGTISPSSFLYQLQPARRQSTTWVSAQHASNEIFEPEDGMCGDTGPWMEVCLGVQGIWFGLRLV